MKCPICTTVDLKSLYFEDNLPAHGCPTCRGIWLNANDYLTWLTRHGADVDTVEVRTDATIPVEDVKQAKFCPDDGHYT